ncbi:MAG: peptidoglycan-binding domain-containing protein [Candidatus Wolfebacteria bacterium]|nr:peptidoglycan-binding domain-containing protein [Candidatus Wolfebacteria bacterium]
MSFSNQGWQPKTGFSQPNLQKRQIAANDSATQNNGLIVSGLITNNNAYDLSLIDIVSVVFNKDGKAISAAQTLLKNVAAFREMSFSISFPKNISLVKEETPAPKISPFTRDLTLGAKGDDVLQLERFLKDQGYFTNEPDTYFGIATRDAIIKYQKQVGISPAAGYFGGKTRADINALAAKPASVALNPNQADPIKTEVYVEGIR